MSGVYFFPYYFYLHYEPFRRVIKSLTSEGTPAWMVYMPCSALDEHVRFGPEQIRQDGCPHKILSILPAALRHPGLLARIGRMAWLPISRRRIDRFIGGEQPSLVVVGSDLGNSYFRVMLAICRRQCVPVLILATVDSGPDARSERANGRPPGWTTPAPLLRLAGLEALLFRGWVLGSYQRDAAIAVAGPEAKNRLVRQGIAAERITVTGSPIHDLLHDLQKTPPEEARKGICTRLGWPEGSQIIVYCTERVQDLYGEEYLKRVNRLLRSTFDELPQTYRIVVKLHPQEDRDSAREFAAAFSGERYQVVKDLDLYAAVRAAELTIAHFSAVLVDSVLLGTPVLSLNLRSDRRRSLFDDGAALVTIGAEGEVQEKVRGLLLDPGQRETARRLLAGFAAEHAAPIDGHSAERVADLVRRLAQPAARERG